MIITLRFIFGVVLAGGLSLWVGMPLAGVIILAVAGGLMASVWGDKFLMSLMNLMRYLR